MAFLRASICLLCSMATLAACSSARQQPVELSQAQLNGAINVATGIAKRYYTVPTCSDENANWHYIAKRAGDLVLVEVGPGQSWGHGVRVTFKRDGMTVVASQHLA